MKQLQQFQKSIKFHCQQHQFLNNTYNYSITITISQPYNIKLIVTKTKKQLQQFHQSIRKYIFQLDEPFEKKYIEKDNPEETKEQINEYFSRVRERIDLLTLRQFVSFLQLDTDGQLRKLLTKEYVQELTDININAKKEELVDVQWEPNDKILFVVSQCKKEKKLKNFFKMLISDDAGLNGTLQLIKFSQKENQWIKIHSQLIQAQPIKITWNSKSSILILSTTIGIYVFMVGLGTEEPELNLIDFVQLPGISSVLCDSQIGNVYILGNGINYQGKSKLISYSIKNQSKMQIPLKLKNARSMVMQKTHRRLFLSEDEGIKIFKIESDTQKIMIENFKKLHVLACDSTFDQLTLSSEQKPSYLFGYNRKGFITVFQIKPPEKQFLMNILTNIECPQNYNSIERIWSKKLFCVDFQSHLVFITMKNQPFWVKQNGIGTGKIKKIIFDEENQRLMYCGNQMLKICSIDF